MTDEMTVQAQRPSAMPYVAGGALVGGGIGAASAHWGNFGVPSPKYSSWEDAINDSNDEFVKKQIEKNGDKKADWEKVQNAQNDVKNAQKKMDDALSKLEGDDLKNAKAYLEKVEAFEKEKAKLLKELESKAKLTGDDLANALKNDGPYTTILGQVKEKITNFDDKNVEKSFNDAIAAAKDDTQKTELKNLQTKYNEAYPNSPENIRKRAMNAIKEEANQTDAYKNAMKAKNDATRPEKFTDEMFNAYKQGKNALRTAKENAEKVLTDDLLKGLKSAHVLKTAGVGAILLGLGALLLRPKAE